MATAHSPETAPAAAGYPATHRPPPTSTALAAKTTHSTRALTESFDHVVGPLPAMASSLPARRALGTSTGRPQLLSTRLDRDSVGRNSLQHHYPNGKSAASSTPSLNFRPRHHPVHRRLKQERPPVHPDRTHRRHPAQAIGVKDNYARDTQVAGTSAPVGGVMLLPFPPRQNDRGSHNDQDDERDCYRRRDRVAGRRRTCFDVSYRARHPLYSRHALHSLVELALILTTVYSHGCWPPRPSRSVRACKNIADSCCSS